MHITLDPRTLHETLAVLCELAGLGDDGLQDACAELAKREKDALTLAVLSAVADESASPEGRALTIRVEEALELVDQLEALLLDMELMLPLRMGLTAPERLRRELLLEAVRKWIKRGVRKRDERVLAILAEGSRRLGDLVLTSPERWFDEGVGQLLGDLSGLAGAVRVEAERLDVEEVVSASRYPALLGALWRGVEGREARWGDQMCRQLLEGRVSAEALEVAVGVARRVVLSETRRVAGVEFKMVYCPPGEFWMGSEEGVGNDWERPRHRVRISQPFLIGQTQVTEELWESVMWASRSAKPSAVPLTGATWYDAVRFCNALSGLDNLQPVYEIIGTGDQPTVSLDLTANGYRLPTEAQWEYAAKAGTELVYAGSDDLDAVAWHSVNADHWKHPVGQKKPNAWGLYDMSGNVSEWCADRWDLNTYKSRSSTVTDPVVYAAEPSPRVVRGGCWALDADRCRVASRRWDTPYSRTYATGIRLLRSNLG